MLILNRKIGGTFAILAGLTLLFLACDLSGVLLGFTLNRDSLNLVQSQTFQLVAKPYPSTTKLPTLLWSTSNAAIAAVDQNGLITAGGAGIATISAQTIDGNKTAQCIVVVWQKDTSNFLQFTTNDTTFYDWGFWLVPPGQTSRSLDSNPVTVVLQKTTGSATKGYGFLFCYSDDNNFYRLTINTQQQIRVTKTVGGNSYSLGWDWVSNSDLLPGQNVANTLSVTRNASQLIITVNNAITRKILISDTTFSAGIVAFYAAVGNATDEMFPGKAEDIRIKLTAPITYP